MARAFALPDAQWLYQSRGGRRSRRTLLAVAAAAATVVALAPGSATASPQQRSVVVTGASATAAADAVRAAGGDVVGRLPLVRGVVARLTPGALLPGFVVSPDRRLTVDAAATTDDVAGTSARSALGLAPDGSEGAGVTVAVVDTGVAAVPDLAGRVTHVDVTGTGGGDGYGHGTFMAGLIAGDGSASGGVYRGVAPAAHILDVKVADAEGTTSLSDVLEGLQVVATRGVGHGVRVVNLSLSSESPLPYQVDPLDQALEALWRMGVTVVVPAGNDGPAAGTIASPGNDPVLLTAGSLETQATAARADDAVSDFSGRGPTRQGVSKPDLVAPGSHLVSTKSPGSVVDVSNPTSSVGSAYMRGTGTSQATAVTSAAAAALLAQRPWLRPDTVKDLLTGSAYTAGGLGDRFAAGSGGLDLPAALDARAGGAGHDGDAAGPPAGDDDAWQALVDAFDAGDRAAAYRAWRALSPQSRAWALRTWQGLDGASRSWGSRSWGSRNWGSSRWDQADGTAEEWLTRYWASRSWGSRSWGSRSWGSRSWGSRSWGSRSWGSRSWGSRSWGDWDWAGDDWASRSWGSRSWGSRSWGVTTWS